MAQDKTGTWSLGESHLWYSPSSGIDATWSLGESFIFDEYAPTESSIPIIMKHYRTLRS